MKTGRRLVLYARPRIAALHRWPHQVVNGRVDFDWVIVKPDGAGWSKMGPATDDESASAFPIDDLDDVLEAFFENAAGPYPFDFSVRVIEPSAKTAPGTTTITIPGKKGRKSTVVELADLIDDLPSHQPADAIKAKPKTKRAKRKTPKSGERVIAARRPGRPGPRPRGGRARSR